MSHQPPKRYYQTVIPHLMINGAANAIEFYKKAFGASELFRIAQPDGTIVHAEMKIEESVFMVGDAGGLFSDPLSQKQPSVGLHVYIEDVDTFFAQAVDAGVEVIEPVRDMFYGDRMAMIKDPFGHIWVFLTHIKDMTTEEIKKSGEKMFE